MPGFHVAGDSFNVVWTLFFYAISSTAGCGSASVSNGSKIGNGAEFEGRSEKELVGHFQKRATEQTARISELELRLALLESETREFRATIEQEQRRQHTRTVRIGAVADAANSPDSDSDESDREPEDPNRPVLRLYGSVVNRPAPLDLPPLPPGVPDRLPVAPLPEDPSPSGSALPETVAPETGEAAVLYEYRAALGLMRRREFDQALAALSDFLARHPDHAYADNAVYWRGEVYYAKRDYGRALREFETVASRFPSSRKMPDSLLKIGMCFRRMGKNDQALNYFRRVLRQYPDSDAARIASREGAT